MQKQRQECQAEVPWQDCFMPAGGAVPAQAVWKVPFMVTMVRGQGWKGRPRPGDSRYKPKKSKFFLQEKGSLWNSLEIQPNQSLRKCA